MGEGNSNEPHGGFWKRLPTAVQAIVAILGAIAAFVTALAAAGLIGGQDSAPTTVATPMNTPDTSDRSDTSDSSGASYRLDASVTSDRSDRLDMPSGSPQPETADDKPVEWNPSPTVTPSTAQEITLAPPRNPAPIARTREYPHRAVLSMSRIQSISLLNAPKSTSKEIASIRRGAEFAVGERIDDWYPARLSTGETGWVHESLITVIPEN